MIGLPLTALSRLPEFREGELTPIDLLEARIVELGGQVRPVGADLCGFPVEHRFTPGLYIREFRAPAGSYVTSKVHLTRHPFTVSAGRVNVFLEETRSWEQYAAPHTGVTAPGTRRFLEVLEDLVWTTYHPTRLTDPEAIEKEILMDYQNPLLPLLEAGQ